MDKQDAIKCLKSMQQWVPDWDGREDGLSYWDAIDMAIAALDTPNAEKPPCYLPEKDNPYPLCEGRGMKACAHCCLWEDYDPEEDEGRVNQPLTMRQLREMDGEPVWVVLVDEKLSGLNGWYLVHHGSAYLARIDDWELDDDKYGVEWLAYRRPKEEQ